MSLGSYAAGWTESVVPKTIIEATKVEGYDIPKNQYPNSPLPQTPYPRLGTSPSSYRPCAAAHESILSNGRPG